MTRDTINLYLNFAIYAVWGKLAEADALMRRYGAEVEAVAALFRAKLGAPARPLYRGLLLDGTFDPSGREFTSWSEDRACAEWFADPRSVMNEYMAIARPHATGYVLTAPPSAEGVLFHHAWGRALDLPSIAASHDHEAARQIAWSLATQREVITEPLDAWPTPEPLTLAPSIEPLDRRYAPPWIVHQQLAI